MNAKPRDFYLRNYQTLLLLFIIFHTCDSKLCIFSIYRDFIINTWCNMLLIGLHHSPVVDIPLLLPTNSSTLPFSFFPLCAWELGAIIIIITSIKNTFCYSPRIHVTEDKFRWVLEAIEFFSNYLTIVHTGLTKLLLDPHQKDTKT